jgi:hypothetical protein
MSKKLLTLSQDEQSIMDDAGNVLYVATKDKNGDVYFDIPSNISRGRVCIGWDTTEVCLKWDKDHSLCLSLSGKKVCIEWST